MGRSQQFLHPGMGGQSYLDTFAVVGPRWTARAGTLAAGLQAATLAAWPAGGNKYNNPTFEGVYVGGVAPDWTAAGAATTTEQVGRTGSAQGVAGGGAAGDNVYQTRTLRAPFRYAFAGYGRIAAGAGGGIMRLFTSVGVLPANVNVGVIPDGDGAWNLLGPLITEAVLANGTVTTRLYATAAATTAAFDDVSCYLASAVATLNWGSPNIQITLDLAIPAAPSVVPFSAVVRYTDTLNYWEVRTTPNTAGDDLEIIEVVAGVETVRASADVDWTAGGTDQMRVNVYGTTTAVEVKKSGAPAFTAACSYTTMATGLTARDHGLMFYGTGVSRCTRWQSA